MGRNYVRPVAFSSSSYHFHNINHGNHFLLRRSFSAESKVKQLPDVKPPEEKQAQISPDGKFVILPSGKKIPNRQLTEDEVIKMEAYKNIMIAKKLEEQEWEKLIDNVHAEEEAQKLEEARRQKMIDEGKQAEVEEEERKEKEKEKISPEYIINLFWLQNRRRIIITCFLIVGTIVTYRTFDNAGEKVYEDALRQLKNSPEVCAVFGGSVTSEREIVEMSMREQGQRVRNLPKVEYRMGTDKRRQKAYIEVQFSISGMEGEYSQMKGRVLAQAFQTQDPEQPLRYRLLAIKYEHKGREREKMLIDNRLANDTIKIYRRSI